MTTIERSFAGVTDSVPHGRAWLGKELELAGVAPGAVADAALVLSELLTNALVHSRSAGPHGSVLVRLRLGVSRLRIEVTDTGGVGAPMARRNGHLGNGHPGNGHPPYREDTALAPPTMNHTALAESGHGLALVEAFTSHWWTRGDSRGRTVCAEIPLDGQG